VIRPPTLGTLGIAGAVVGLIGLCAPPIWRAFQAPPVATIDAPTPDAAVAACFVAKGRVVPSTIRRPLWLLKAEGPHRWREVGQIYPPPGTWASRVCVNDRGVHAVRLALVVADYQLDAALSRLVPAQEEEEIPDWLRRRNHTEQQGANGRRHGFLPLPAGATLVAPVVDVRLRRDVDWWYVYLRGSSF
jgi:hypothetical protein